MEDMHQQKVEKMIKSAEGRAGLTSQSQRCGGEEYRDRCEAKRKEWATHWQCDEEIQQMQNKPWRNEEFKE